MDDDQKTVALGDFIEIRCRYCRLNLDGVVASIVDGRPVKVKCRTCNHFQNYKPPVPESVTREKALRKVMRLRDGRVPSGPSSAPMSPEAVARRLWEEATADANPLKAKIYDSRKSFLLDDLITHREWGLGRVREVGEDGTVLVLFREGFKRLEHER